MRWIGSRIKLQRITAIATILMCLASPALCQPPASSPSKSAAMQCFFGPVSKKFAGAPWLVYACDDGKSLVVVTSQHNPASPFYFLISPNGGALNIHGEGNGSKTTSDAAGDDIRKMSVGQVAELWVQAKAIGLSPPR